jgi:uncharacterized membrane protein
MEYINRLAWTVLYIIVTVVVFTGVMNFISVSSTTYSPFLYFTIALFIFSLLLSPIKPSALQ